jgi:ribosome-binding protein aMBF1 (putative translation factor)
MTTKTIKQWIEERGLTIEQLAEQAAVDARVIRHLVAGQWTTSPQQRERIAKALGVPAGEIRWGHSNPVDHMYGHGPQFGRSP